MTETNKDLIATSETPEGKKIPLIELFGPTIQGEGLMAGTISHFLRIGGCPLKCEWCDSMYAVDPKQVQENAEWLTSHEVLQRVNEMPWAPYITFTGGDPAMWDPLGDMIEALNMHQVRVAIETQGTIIPSWLGMCDVVTFSPKPPSSGNPVPFAGIVEWLQMNMHGNHRHNRVCIKIVVFTREDYEYAKSFLFNVPWYLYDAFYFTSGTPLLSEQTPEDMQSRLSGTLMGFSQLAEMVLADAQKGMQFSPHTHVGCQQHVLLWPEADKGV